MTTPLLTPKDVAHLLVMSERTVLDELRRKNLIGIKTPSGWRIDEDDLATSRPTRTVSRTCGRSGGKAPGTSNGLDVQSRPTA